MKIFSLILLLMLSVCGYSQNSVYDYKLKSLSGDTIDLNDFRGKMLLIVNTATSSSYVSQLDELEILRQQYADSGLVILAVPSNDFGNQSDTSATGLAGYSALQYYVSEMQSVIGDNRCPLYNWICQGNLNGLFDNVVNSDFKKFLINRNGRIVGAFTGKAAPTAEVVIESLTLNK